MMTWHHAQTKLSG